MGTAGEIVIWMVLAALVGFATGWALRSVVANRARSRLSDRLEEKRRETQDLREELRQLRGDDDDDVMRLPTGSARVGRRRGREDSEPHLSATAEHDEVELGPLDEPTIAEDEGDEGDDERDRRFDAARCASTRSSGRTCEWTRPASARTRTRTDVNVDRGAEWEGEGRLHPPARCSPASSRPRRRPAPAADVRGVIQKVEQLRGLRTTHPLAVSTVDAAAMRGVVLRQLEREREPRSDAGWDDALHLLGVLRPGQSLEQVQRRALTGQVAGVYVPRDGRLYVLGSGGYAPRSVVAHEVVHALQDEHFQLTRGPFAARPRDHDGELAATSARRGRRHRGAGALRRGALAARSDRRARARRSARCRAAGADATAPYLERQLLFPYTAGQEFVRALRARGGQRLLDRAFRNPPRTTAAVLDPARYLAGDPPAAGRSPARRKLPLHDHVRGRGRGRPDRESALARGLAGRAHGRREQGTRAAPRDRAAPAPSPPR